MAGSRNFPPDGLPYAAFYFAAIVPWNFFTYILTQSSNCLTVNFHLLNKVYFPRLILPLKTVLVAVVDFALACSLIVAVMIYYQLVPSTNIVWLPVFLLLAVLTGLGVGVWFAALNAYFRDLVNLLPYLHADLVLHVGDLLSPARCCRNRGGPWPGSTR